MAGVAGACCCQIPQRCQALSIGKIQIGNDNVEGSVLEAPKTVKKSLDPGKVESGSVAATKNTFQAVTCGTIRAD